MDRRIDTAPYRRRTPEACAAAGDWHGNRAHAIEVLRALANQGVDLLLQLGDFGVWPGDSGRNYLRAVENVCAENGIDIFVTPGNHDHWSRFRTMWDDHPHKHRDDEGNELPLRLTDHITALPRGWRFTLTSPSGRDVTFVSLGGAPSIDFPDRRPGRDWWPEEMIRERDIDAVAVNGYADVFLAHDAPDLPYATPKVAAILNNPSGWTRDGLLWAARGRERMHRAFLAVKPRLFLHGHFHVYDETWVQLEGVDYPTRIVSLNCDGANGNYMLLDLDQIERA